MIKMKLRAPLMIQQVQQLMENSRFDGSLEFHHYWDGYISALRDAGMITENGENALREFAEEINGSCVYEPEYEPAVDPKALMQEIANRYPLVVAPAKVADVVSTTDHAAGERSEANHAGDVKPDVVSIIRTSPTETQSVTQSKSGTPTRRGVRR